MAKRGRKAIEIDLAKAEYLFERLWSLEQVAAFFEVSDTTLRSRLGPNYLTRIRELQTRGTGRIIDLMWHRAAEGSDKIILHLAQHYLGQHPRIESKSEVTQTTTHNIQIEAKHTELLNLIRTMVSDVPLRPITPSLLPEQPH